MEKRTQRRTPTAAISLRLRDCIRRVTKPSWGVGVGQWKVKGESRVRTPGRTRTYAVLGSAQRLGRPAPPARSLWGGARAKARDACGPTFTVGRPPLHPRFHRSPFGFPRLTVFLVFEGSVLFRASLYATPPKRAEGREMAKESFAHTKDGNLLRSLWVGKRVPGARPHWARRRRKRRLSGVGFRPS